MPIYTYRREDGTTFEQRQSFMDQPLELCPTTGQKVTRLIQAPGIIFKGSGFYVNDSKKATNGNLGGKTKESDSKESAPADTTPTATESKAETKEVKTAVKESAAD